MSSLGTNFRKAFKFIRTTRHYYRDVLLMHVFLLFILTPSLSQLTKLLLNQGESTIFPMITSAISCVTIQSYLLASF